MISAKPGWVCFIAACLANVWSVGAEPPPPAPQLVNLFPAGGKRGGQVEVTVNGANLANSIAARFQGGKLTAEILPLEKPNPNTLKLNVNIPPDTELGEQELRLVTHGGVSNCLRFVVGDLPEINETEPNSELSQAQVIDSLPVVVNGQISSEDRDYIRFRAKAGQTFVFDVCGRRLRPFLQVDERVGWFDPCLALYDAAGKELKFVDDFRFNPDPVLMHTFEQDGEFVVCLRDTLFRGRPEFVYRLTIGPVPYITSYFPPGGRCGTEFKLQLVGANVPGETPVPLPAAGGREHTFRVTRDGIASNAIALAVTDLPEANEAEVGQVSNLPGSTAETSTSGRLETRPTDHTRRVTPPAVINGRIDKPGDADSFVFSAQKGQRFVVETTARRFGSPLDAFLQILNAQGSQVASNDDAVAVPEQPHQADARLDYTFPADGDYTVRIRDFVRRGGEEFVYRLTIAPPKPDFELKLRPTDPPLPNPRVTTVQTIARGVGPGGSAVLNAELVRKDGLAGEVQLTAQGLPAGFQLSPATLAPNQNQTLLTITAPTEAALGTIVPLEIVGSAKIAETEVKHIGVATESHSYISDERRPVLVREALLSVTPPPPFRVTIASPTASVTQDGKVELKVNVQRQPDVKGAVTVSVQGLPGNVTVPAAKIPEDQAEATITLTAAGKATVGTHNIVIVGTMAIGNQQISQPAAAVTLTVAAK